MQKLRIVPIILAFIFLINLVSAGLEIVESPLNINKSADINKEITINIRNTESFPFFNVSFKDNPYIEINRIAEIPSGVTIETTATITTNENVDVQVDLIGFFESQVGQQNAFHNVTISAFQSEPCDLTIIEGDSIVWKNTLFSEVLLMDSSTDLPIDGAVIPSNNTFTKLFPTPQIFRHYFAISGFPFPQVCQIVVLDDSGLVNDPNLNALLNLKVTNNFEPTTVSVIMSKIDYSLKFYETKEGVLTITNTGSKPVKDIRLNEQWLSFNKNNFDIPVGDEIPVIYTLNPKIFSTEETNKTHNRTLTITGNFPSKEIKFDVFIEHAFINEDMTNLTNSSTLIDILCAIRPDLCEPQIMVIYRDGSNGTSSSTTVSITQESFNAQQLAQLELSERFSVLESFLKETVSGQTDEVVLTTKTTSSEVRLIKTDLADLKKTIENAITNGGIFIITLLVFLSVAILSFIVIKKWRANLGKEFGQY